VLTLNSLEAIQKVRLKLPDVDDLVFDIPEKFGAMDDALRDIYGRVRMSGQYHGLDRLDVSPGQFTQVDTDVLEYELPEYVGDIQLIEGLTAPGVPGVPIRQSSLEDFDQARGVFTRDDRVWFRSRYDGPGSIQIRGRSGGITTYRFWYIRQWGALHYGPAASGSTTTLVPGAVSGNYKARNGAYDGMLVEVTSDTATANVDQVRRVSTFVGGTMTFSSPWPSAISANTNYAIVLPIPPETTRYFVERVVRILLLDRGDQPSLRAREQDYVELQSEFEELLRERDTGEPPRFRSSRQ